MFAHNKRLQYTLRVKETTPGLANLMLEQFGGPAGRVGCGLPLFHPGDWRGRSGPQGHAFRHRYRRTQPIGGDRHDCRPRRAKIVYDRLINLTDDPGLKEALGFLMTREIAHQKSFEKALYTIEPNFPPGKLPGMPEFTNVYFDMSKGGEMRGLWPESNSGCPRMRSWAS